MRFATHLQEEAAKFRTAYLTSNDVQDGTQVTSDWRDTRASYLTHFRYWDTANLDLN